MIYIKCLLNAFLKYIQIKLKEQFIMALSSSLAISIPSQSFSPFKSNVNEEARWVIEDGEPDDFINLLFNSCVGQDNLTVIAEKHGKREEVFERTDTLLKHLKVKNISTKLLQGATDETIGILTARLNQLPNDSLSIQVLAPSPTLQRLIEVCPELLAQKVKRIIAFGGFTYRKPLNMDGSKENEAVYYTTHNLSANVAAAQTLLTFAQTHKTAIFVLGSDALKMARSLSTSLPERMLQCDTPATAYIHTEIEAWNNQWIKDNSNAEAKLKKNVEASSGKSAAEVARLSVTPADTIAAVVANAFEHLTLSSIGLKDVVITDSLRIEFDKKTNGFKESYHRKVTFAEDETSTLRLITGFQLGDKDTTATFKHITEQFFLAHKQSLRD